MKKQSLFLLFAVALAACGAPSASTQSPSATPAQTPASDVDPTWQTYTNEEGGFSIQYPSNWQAADLPDENAGQRHHVALTGPEGAVELVWGVGLGGACPEGYEPIAIANGTWDACHSQREDGTELWSLSGQSGETSFGGLVYTNDTTAESRALVLQVLSTLSFP